MHCVNYAKREQEKRLLFKLTLRSRSTLSQARSDTCHELLVVFGLSTLNSNRTNHKPRKKLASQKHRHMSLRLCGIQTLYYALIRRRSLQKVQSVCDAGNPCRVHTIISRAAVDPTWRSCVGVRPRSKNVLFASCGPQIPFTWAYTYWSLRVERTRQYCSFYSCQAFSYGHVVI